GLAGGRKWFLPNPPSLYGMKHRGKSAGSGGRGRREPFGCFPKSLSVDGVALSPTIT
ncbi:hypothetical protein QBC32DRAFT_171399, partial [Pseudoneurospora amorphoporcata]